jgi:hypothetical protein
MSTIKTNDGTEIYYKDWGEGQPIVFSHGWPLSADDWDTQMLFFLGKGFRVIAHDRRGHGRSTQPGDGRDMDHYADDLAELTAHLDLKDAVPADLPESVTPQRKKRSDTEGPAQIGVKISFKGVGVTAFLIMRRMVGGWRRQSWRLTPLRPAFAGGWRTLGAGRNVQISRRCHAVARIMSKESFVLLIRNAISRPISSAECVT